MPLAIIATFLGGSHGAPQNLRRREQGLSLISYGQIMSGDSHLKACIEIPPEAYNKVEKELILGDCSSSDSGWRFDPNGRIHSQWNDDYCIEVHAHEGAHLRLVPCDDDNLLQRFVYHVHGEAIRPRSFQELCMTWQGNHADVGTDPVLVKECDQVEHQRHWIGNFPRYDDEPEQSLNGPV